MTRRINAIGALLLLPALVATCAADDWTGPYAGLGGGYQTGGLDSRARLGGDRLGLDLESSGALLSGYGGYGWSRGSLYLGGEAQHGFGALEGRLRLNDRSIAHDGREPWGVSGIMGGFVNRDTLLYGRAGYQQRSTESSLGGFRDEDWLNGVRLGAGARFRLWDHTSLRLEFSHVWYDDERAADSADSIEYRAGESWFEAGGILRF